MEPEWLYEAGYVAYVFFCLFGVCLFVEGLAIFCAGLTGSKSVLSQVSYSMICIALVTVQFYAIGYSFEYSDNLSSSWSKIIGDFHFMFLRNVDLSDVTVIGKVILQYSFSVVPACLLASAACQRGRLLPLIVFIFTWMTFVYCPIARWCWHPGGWSYNLGVLDYAGGTIIHINAGFAALVYSLVLGPRTSYTNGQNELPYSLTMVVQGTVLMWLGWIGFTGGAQVQNPAEALLSVCNTWLSASAGGFSWMILDSIVTSSSDPVNAGEEQEFNVTVNNNGTYGGGDPEFRLSIVSFCSGVVSGLVAITPAAGYVPIWSAPLIGCIGAIGCNWSTRIKFYLGVDDPLDIFAVHGIGGLIGTMLTGIFATSEYTRRFQLWYQFFSAITAAAYTLGCTLIIAVTIDSIPHLQLRIPVSDDVKGLDQTEHGELGTYQTENLMPEMHNPIKIRRATEDQPLLQRLPLSYGLYSNAMPPHHSTSHPTP